jgi:hypothetical protein
MDSVLPFEKRERRKELLNLISKEDFIESVRASMSLDAIKTAQLAPLDTNERLKLVTLSVMNWATTQKQQTGNNLYISFRSVANWIAVAQVSVLLPQEEEAQLCMRGIDPLLELIWDCTQEARGDMKEVLTFLHSHLRTDQAP